MGQPAATAGIWSWTRRFVGKPCTAATGDSTVVSSLELRLRESIADPSVRYPLVLPATFAGSIQRQPRRRLDSVRANAAAPIHPREPRHGSAPGRSSLTP